MVLRSPPQQAGPTEESVAYSFSRNGDITINWAATSIVETGGGEAAFGLGTLTASSAAALAAHLGIASTSPLFSSFGVAIYEATRAAGSATTIRGLGFVGTAAFGTVGGLFSVISLPALAANTPSRGNERFSIRVREAGPNTVVATGRQLSIPVANPTDLGKLVRAHGSDTISGLRPGTLYEIQGVYNSGFHPRTRYFTIRAGLFAFPNPQLSLFTILEDTAVTANTIRCRATFNLTEANPYDDGDITGTYYYRWRTQGGSYSEMRQGTGTYAFAQGESRTSENFAISELQPDTVYEIQASPNAQFTGAPTLTVRTQSAGGGTGGTNIQRVDVQEIRVDRITETAARATVYLRQVPTRLVSVYFRYRPSGQTTWTTLSRTTRFAQIAFNLSNLDPGTLYTVQANTDQAFPGISSQTFFTTDSTPVAPTAALDITSAYVDRITRTTTRLNAVVNRTDATARVYARWRQTGTSAWTDLTDRGLGLSARTNWSITGLTAGTEYEAEVSLASTYTDPETTSWTTEAPVVVVVPPVVQGIDVPDSDVTTTTAVANVTLDRSPVESITVYIRYRQSGTTDAYAEANRSTVVTGASFDLTNLTPATTYEIDASTDSGFAADVVSTTFTTDRVVVDLTRPIEIAAFSAANVTRTSADLRVSLSRTDASRSVYVRYRIDGARDWTVTTSQAASASSLTFSISGLTEAMDYEAQASLNSDYSDPEETEFRTRSAPPVVGQEPRITAINTSVASNGFLATVVIQNPDSSNYVYFRYRRDQTSNWLTHPRQGQDVRGNSFSQSGLQPVTRYILQASLNSDYSDPFEVSVNTSAGAPPPPPDVTQANARDFTLEVSNVTQTTISILAILKFDFFFRRNLRLDDLYARIRPISRSSYDPEVRIGGGNQIRFPHTFVGLTEGTTYQIQVADNTGFSGVNSVTIRVTTVANTVPAIEALSSPSQTTDSITLATQVFNPPATIYWRYREDIDGSAWSEPLAQPLAGTPFDASLGNRRKAPTFVIRGLQEDTGYIIQVGLNSRFTRLRSLQVNTDFRRPTVTGWRYSVADDRVVTLFLDIVDSRPDWRAVAVVTLPAGSTIQASYAQSPTYDFLGHDEPVARIPLTAYAVADQNKVINILLTTETDDGNDRQDGLNVTLTLPGSTWPQLTGLEVDDISTQTARAVVRFTRPAQPTPGGEEFVLNINYVSNGSYTTPEGFLQATWTAGERATGGNRLAPLGIPSRLTFDLSGLYPGTEYEAVAELYGYELRERFTTVGSIYGDLAIDRLMPTSFDIIQDVVNPEGRIFYIWLPVPDRVGRFTTVTSQDAILILQFLDEIFVAGRANIIAQETNRVPLTALDNIEPETEYIVAAYPNNQYDILTLIDHIVVTTPAFPVISIGEMTFDEFDGYGQSVRACVPITNPRGNTAWQFKESTETDWPQFFAVVPATDTTCFTLTGIERGKTYDVRVALTSTFFEAVTGQVTIPTADAPTGLIVPMRMPRIDVGYPLHNPDQLNTWIERINYLQRQAGDFPNPDLTTEGRDNGEGRIILPWQNFTGIEALRRYVRTAGRGNEQALILANYQGSLVQITPDGRADVLNLMDVNIPNTILPGSLYLAPGTWLNTPVTRSALYYDGTNFSWVDIQPPGVRYEYYVERNNSGGRTIYQYFLNPAPQTAPFEVPDICTFKLGGSVRFRFGDGGDGDRAGTVVNQKGDTLVTITPTTATNIKVDDIEAGDCWSINLTAGRFDFLSIRIITNIRTFGETLT